jgi:hypothetical protein
VLKLKVPIAEAYDEANGEFVASEFFTLELEHSLASLSKWEAEYEKPFLGEQDKSNEEILGYIVAMTLNDDVPAEVYGKLSEENLYQVNRYINSKMTATTIHEIAQQRKSREVITSEIIYYWMVSLQIPFETQHWHLNRLITLVRVVNLKNSPPKKVGRKTAAQQQRDLNAARRAQLGTRG